MPGYRTIAESVTGSAADNVRAAEAHQRDGDPSEAVRLLEEALESSVALRPELPGWLVGRLAALYRTLGRYDDEVHLLERYQSSQTSDDARARYDARLSKARIIADRERPRDSGALASVRKVIGAPRTRRRTPSTSLPSIVAPAVAEELAAAFADNSPAYERRMSAVLARLNEEARANGRPVESLVELLKAAAAAPAAQQLAEAQRTGRYGAALVELLGGFYGTDGDGAA